MKNVIGDTLGVDIKDHRYRSGHTTRPIYTIDDFYFAVGKNKPTDEVGEPWEKYDDQFFAQRANTILWVSKMKRQKRRHDKISRGLHIRRGNN